MKKITFLIMIALMISINVNAQWTTDTAINTLVADSESGDMKAIGTSEGKTYVVFWKAVSAPINYELRLQMLGVDGSLMLGNDGILVSDQIPMSTFTYIWNITIDENDNLYIGATGSGGGEPAYVFKLDTTGNHLWGTNGVNIGSGFSVTFLPLSSGETIVSWWPGSQGLMQKYDASGTAIWGSTQSITEGANDTVPANIFEHSDGGYMMVFHSLTFGINSILYGQRYNNLGESQWANPTQLADYGTVFNTTYSGLQDGDVVYMGYKASPGSRFDSFLQRLNPDGTLPWGINGSDFDTNQTDYEMNTQISFQPGSQNVWAICTYTTTSQGEKGEYVQKFDKDSGTRLLTENAKVIYPIGSEKVHAGSLYLKDDAPLFLLKSGIDNGVSPTTLGGVLLDDNGDIVLNEDDLSAATFSANKGRIQFTKPINNQSIAVFIEDKGAGERIYAQNITHEILSVNDVDYNSIFYVNPVSENWTIKSENTITSILIYNVLGQFIFKLKNNSSNVVSINTENWNSGIYIMNVYTNLGVISKRVIKN